MTIDPVLAFLGFILWGRSGSGGSPTTTTIPAKTPPVWVPPAIFATGPSGPPPAATGPTGPATGPTGPAPATGPTGPPATATHVTDVYLVAANDLAANVAMRFNGGQAKRPDGTWIWKEIQYAFPPGFKKSGNGPPQAIDTSGPVPHPWGTGFGIVIPHTWGADGGLKLNAKGDVHTITVEDTTL